VLVLGGGPCRADCRISPRQGGAARGRGSRPRTRSAARPRRSISTPGYRFRPRRAPLLSSPSRSRSTCSGTRSSARSSCCGRGCRGSTERSLPRLPAAGARTCCASSAPVELCRCVASYAKAALTPRRRRNRSRTGSRTVSAGDSSSSSSSPIPRRSGGVPTSGDPRRVGRAADQGALVRLGRPGRLLRQPRQQVKSLISEFNYPALRRPRPGCGRR